MAWNWQHPDWPNFTWDTLALRPAEDQFLSNGGLLAGILRHLIASGKEQAVIESISLEAIATSEIEGEILDRASVQSSIRKQLGLPTEPDVRRRVRPAEQGIAELMVDLFHSYAKQLAAENLFGWHTLLMSGRADLQGIGHYRAGDEPMQVVSGSFGNPRIHFEAPPSHRVAAEMAEFVAWFNRTGPYSPRPLPALTRAGVAHLYFESIHPFEDGNGRIGRAIAEKAIAQAIGQPAFALLSATILAHRKAYYDALENANKSNEVTAWLQWFAGIALEAQRRAEAQIEFVIGKTQLLDRLRGQLNPRQEKSLQRMLREGPDGFIGGLSAANYIAITGASTASATRDLADMVDKGALERKGERRHARYFVKMTSPA